MNNSLPPNNFYLHHTNQNTMELTMQDVVRILVSLIIGACIGLEREYRTKPAGFRTVILICIGSTLFTMMSIKLGAPNNMDRIASYVLVGVGFIGSGVIFKEGLKVTGLTTAATIWITAAVGLAVGNGNFLLALLVTAISLLVLEIFARFENKLDRWNASKVFMISFKSDENVMEHLEQEFERICPSVRRLSMKCVNDVLTCAYKVHGGTKKFKELQKYLLKNEKVIGFES